VEDGKITKPTTIAQLKMKDACILCNIIENVLIKKNNQDRKKEPLWPFGAPNGISTIL
jgi:hypothetical protein